MIEEKNYLKEVKTYTNSYVTFDDGTKGKIMGKGKLVYPCLSNLEDALLVEGLTTNLISISHYVTMIFVSTSLVLNTLS